MAYWPLRPIVRRSERRPVPAIDASEGNLVERRPWPATRLIVGLVFVAMLWPGSIAHPATVLAADLVLTSPASGANVPAYGAVFAWTAVEEALGYRIQVADNPAFAEPYLDDETVHNRYRPSTDVIVGATHWRVAAKGPEGIGPWVSGQFTTVWADAPALTAPATGSTFLYPLHAPVLRWTPVIGASYYEVWFTLPGETEPYWQFAAATALVLAPGLPPGAYSWKVRARGAGPNASAFSATRSLVVEWPDAPVQLAPADGAELANPVLSWKAVPGAVSYEYQLALTPSFDGIQPYGTRALSTSLPWGWHGVTVYWRVRALFAPGGLGMTASPWSASRVVLDVGVVEGPVGLWPPDGSIHQTLPTLRWAPDPEASAYQLQVRSDPSLLNDIDGCTVQYNSFSFVESANGNCRPPSAGTVYWQVRILGNTHTPGPSTMGSFEYDPPTGGPALTEPVKAILTSPADCSVGDPCQAHGAAPLLTWAPVSGAAFYRVLVAMPNGGGGALDDVVGTSYVPSRLLSNEFGEAYGWAVIACPSVLACADVTSAPPDRSFRIVHTPPVLESPADGAVVNGPLSFSWTLPTVDAPAAGQPWPLLPAVDLELLEVSDTPDFPSGHQWDPYYVLERTLYWRVSTSPFGAPFSATSEIRSLVHRVDLPIATAPANGAIVGSLPELRWEMPDTMTICESTVGIGPIVRGYDAATPARVLPPGSHTWRVRCTDRLGHEAPWVQSSFEVAIAAPTLLSPVQGDEVSQPIDFIWSGPADATMFWFESSASSTFDSTVEAGWTIHPTWTNRVAYPSGTVYWRVRAYDGGVGVLLATSAVQSVKVSSPPDTASPSGTVSIAGDSPYARAVAVTVSVSATDASGAVSHVALSNDGASWVTRTYAPTQPWTLSPGDGIKTVHVKWKDDAGNWSSVKTDTIVLDTVTPTASAPTRTFVTGSSLSSGRVAVRLAWLGSDALSGIARYELAQSTDGGPWTTVSTSLAKASLDRSLATQHSYRFRVRPVDKAGNVGAWATGSALTLSRYSEGNTRIRYSGTWRTTRSSVYWGGVAKYALTAGARATFTFTGRSIAWVSRRGPGRGKAEIFVNGTKVATVDLYASSYQNQRVVWSKAWSTTAPRTITIRVVGTSGRPRVDMDAFITGS